MKIIQLKPIWIQLGLNWYDIDSIQPNSIQSKLNWISILVQI
jgi:hypothetical protein